MTMNSNLSLTGDHLQTYEKILKNPISHNVAWREVRALLAHLGEVVEKPNGHLRVTRSGHTVVLRPSAAKEVDDLDQLMKIRHFLKETDGVPPEGPSGDIHMLVVINHHEARLYRAEMRGTVPEKILPHDPDEFFRHAHNSKDFARGREKPDPNSFFEPVARALRTASRILVFGSGTGTSSEMDQFVSWLQSHHADLAGRIVGTVVIDEHHITEAQLLSQARTAYAGNPTG
jgi:hypothetical protein